MLFGATTQHENVEIRPTLKELQVQLLAVAEAVKTLGKIYLRAASNNLAPSIAPKKNKNPKKDLFTNLRISMLSMGINITDRSVYSRCNLKE